ncbi:MAG: serine hydrolase [Flavobacteriales bacterium]|jgi:CubicO group peptidase (beta-lactamase class C family)|nr:serine hydrolase [Flavobacteriales bacterium]|tara:strand:- start:946 stop:2121 length:1176 start_codon:yes stop_codon:yes gene_type:complete
MKKLFFYFIFFIFFLTSIVFIFDVSYLFHGLRCTYLRGQNSAQIDDHVFFYSREVEAKKPYKIPNGYNYNLFKPSEKLKHVLKKSKTIAFLVVQNDSVRFEKYWGGGGENSTTNSFSVAKSITSLLVGCAIDSGFIDNVNQSVFDFLPELKPYKNFDVKIKHLLEMSSGLDWLEHYKKPISVTAKSYYGTNLKNLILNTRFISPPGTIYNYQSGNTQLLGVVLERAVGESVSSFAGRVLWSKIGARKNALWTTDYSGGLEKTFCCFNSNARDFSKIGLLMLNKGDFMGESVVSEDYVNWLLSKPKLYEKIDSHDKVVDYYSNGWWVAQVKDFPVFYARGFNGQYVVVIPELNLVFVRLGMRENEKSADNNMYKLTDNLKLFIEAVISEYSY